jgi:hypothetical protein
MDFFVPAVLEIQGAHQQPAARQRCPGLDGPDGGDPPDIHRRRGVTAAWASTNPAAVLRLYAALLAQVLAAGNAGGPPFAELDGVLVATGLAPSYTTAADGVALNELIRQSIAEAFAAAGGLVGTPTIVLYQDPPVGFLGPVVAAPPTGAEALRLWDSVVALAAVPGVLEFSRPRPPRPEVPGLRLPQP